MRKRLSDKKRAQIIELRNSGETIESTAKRAGVSTASVQRITAANGGRPHAQQAETKPSVCALIVYEIASVAAFKKSKADAFDAIAALTDRLIEL